MRYALYRDEVERTAQHLGVTFDEALAHLLAQKTYSYLPEGYAECPACHGSGIGDPPDELNQKWYPRTVRFACRNCGGLSMAGVATGFTRLRPDGTPCVHEWRGVTAGRCYRVFTCKHCQETYDEDSSD